jgi:hypothetical protein
VEKPSLTHCGHFEPVPSKFGPHLPKLVGLAHDICPKMIFGIFRSKVIQNQKKIFWLFFSYTSIKKSNKNKNNCVKKFLSQKVFFWQGAFRIP